MERWSRSGQGGGQSPTEGERRECLDRESEVDQAGKKVTCMEGGVAQGFRAWQDEEGTFGKRQLVLRCQNPGGVGGSQRTGKASLWGDRARTEGRCPREETSVGFRGQLC